MTVTLGDPGTVIICGDHFDGRADALGGPTEILVKDGRIAQLAPAVSRPPGAPVIDLGGHTVTPGFIDCHVHLTMDAAHLSTQLLDSTATKALVGPRLADDYLDQGFTTLRDLGSADPAQATWFDHEMQALCDTAARLGLPVAVHTGAAQGCKQAIACGARSLEHAYLIDDEAIAMAEDAGTFIVPTMQMTAEDIQALHEGRLTSYTAAKIERDAEQIIEAQRRIAASRVKIAYGTDCGMFPFSHGNLEFQAMVNAGLRPARARRAATGTAADLLDRSDIGVLAPGAAADIILQSRHRSVSTRQLAMNYRSGGRRASTRSSMIWKSPMFSVRRGTPSTWAVAAMARSIWRRLGLPPRRVTAAAS